ncbi:hypothetical protein M0657_005633 [Pyricularia oryzae]|uniref:Uncharacterized protein n=1 Tax=Pyricularia oryzae (strain Y34) TaxID=1143189 RepID=A0AA97NQD7_PYRO3|nr:hypothetical protein OOU_Y34scaffold00766g13 [Pyricularia oryzae Y34]KAI7913401.1 hypothetical protein M9X92_009468 [Pyricularia oryzae]KAI7922364.1 hypothetical protein M0657_005633 [Pyricularia oryzae]
MACMDVEQPIHGTGSNPARKRLARVIKIEWRQDVSVEIVCHKDSSLEGSKYSQVRGKKDPPVN